MKILIADDQAFIRQALADVLMDLQQDVEVIEAKNAAEALQYAKTCQNFDLILMDWVFPGETGGAPMLLAIRDLLPSVPVIVFSGYNDRGRVVEALDAGAMGFISKNQSHVEVLHAVRLVLNGEICLPQSVTVTGPPLPVVRALSTSVTAPAPSTSVYDNSILNALTPQQLRILCLLVQGQPNKIIAKELAKQTGRPLKNATVKSHITRIFEVLGVKNRTQAVIEIFKRGIRIEDISKRIPMDTRTNRSPTE